MTLRIFGSDAPPASLVALSRAMLDEHEPQHLAATARMMTRVDLRQRLGEIGQPVTVVAGGRDRVTPPHLSYELAAALPRCREQWFPRAGHVVPWERPEELVATIAGIAGDAKTGPGANA